MPVTTITLIEGYDDETKERLMKALGRAVRSVIGAPPDGTTVMINEVSASGYMRGGELKNPAPPPPSAANIVQDYLDAMEARDLAAAKSYLDGGFTMTFPGDVTFSTLEELIDWATPRYRWVKKTYERFDEAPADDGTAVTCFGSLRGEWPDGTTFDDIRFVDWFLVEAGTIKRQRVWNDLAEVAAKRTAKPD